MAWLEAASTGCTPISTNPTSLIKTSTHGSGSFPLNLSHHRPLYFHRKTRPPKISCESHSTPIPARALRHSTFRPKLEQLWASWSDRLQHCTPLEQLAELKRAIRITANNILRVVKDIPPVLTEDRLNDAMKCIRWLEAGKHAKIHILLRKKPGTLGDLH